MPRARVARCRDAAAQAAEAFAEAGYHKQLANRLLAPFLHIDVVLTTTDLSKWDALRIDPAAEPHIRDLAIAMREAVDPYGVSRMVFQRQLAPPHSRSCRQGRGAGRILGEAGDRPCGFRQPGEQVPTCPPP